METRANYAAVGGFVIILSAALVIFTVWFTGASLTRDEDRYRIRFEGPVRGLQLGSKVSLLGVQVGQVDRIRLDPEHFGLIDVTISVDEGTPIVEGAQAELRLQGLTGTSFILITGGSAGAAPLQPPEGEDLPVIPATKSELEKLVASAPEIADRVTKLLTRLEGFLSEENAEGFGRIVENVDKTVAHVEQITGDLEANSQSITDLVTDVREVAGSLKKVADNLEGEVPRMTKKVGQTLDSIRDGADKIEVLAGRIDKFTRNADSMITENRPGIRRFTGRGLYEITNLATRLQKVADDISRLARTLSAAGEGAIVGSGRRK